MIDPALFVLAGGDDSKLGSFRVTAVEKFYDLTKAASILCQVTRQVIVHQYEPEF